MKRAALILAALVALAGCSVEAKRVQETDDGRDCWLIDDDVNGRTRLACEEPVAGREPEASR